MFQTQPYKKTTNKTHTGTYSLGYQITKTNTNTTKLTIYAILDTDKYSEALNKINVATLALYASILILQLATYWALGQGQKLRIEIIAESLLTILFGALAITSITTYGKITKELYKLLAFTYTLIILPTIIVSLTTIAKIISVQINYQAILSKSKHFIEFFVLIVAFIIIIIVELLKPPLWMLPILFSIWINLLILIHPKQLFSIISVLWFTIFFFIGQFIYIRLVIPSIYTAKYSYYLPCTQTSITDLKLLLLFTTASTIISII